MQALAKYYKTILMALFAISWPVFFCAQNTVIKHYSVVDGMPSSECYDVMKDQKGYIWIGTDAGVVRYDGYRFKTYNNSKGLFDNTVFKILEDRHGKIWFLTYSGRLFYYLYKTDSIYGIPANSLLSDAIKRFPIDFAVDDSGKLYVSNYINGYIEINYPYDKIKVINSQDNNIFIKELDGKHFLYGRDLLLKTPRLETVNLSYSPFKKKNDFIDQPLELNSRISHLSAVKLYDRNYLITDGTSIIRISDSEKRIVLDSMPDFRSFGVIVSLSKDKENRIWVNTAQHGTYAYEMGDFKKKPLRFLENFTVSNVNEDDHGGFWMTTIENGLYYIPSLKFKFLNKPLGMSSNKIQSIFKYQDNLFALTSDNTINEIELSHQKISVYAKRISSAVNLSGKDHVMIDCGNIPVFVDLNTRKETPLWTKTSSGVIMPPSLRKAIDYNEDYFLGFGVVQVYTIDKKTAECKVLNENFPTIFSIYFDGDKIFVGTKDGLYVLVNNEVEYLGNLHPLLKNRIVDITKENGILFLATRGAGIVCLKDNKVIKVFNEESGLPSNICKSMVSGKNGNVWVGTNRGLFGIKMKNGQPSINRINLIKAFVSSEINQVIEDEEALYFATSNGVGLIDIKDLYSSNTKIPIYIESFWVNGVKQPFDTTFTYKYYQNSVKIEYMGVSQKREGDLQYRYKLEGLDTNWVYTKDVQVQLSLLPPGNYTFSVHVLNENGFYSTVPAKFSFCISAPFWTKWWFHTIEVSVIAFLIYFLYRRRVHIIRSAEKEKTAINKQIAESELTALRAQMNPHFIFNAINSIQNFILKNDSASAHKYLTKFARLIRSVLENSKRDVILLSHEVDALTLYIELEALRASFSFDFAISVHTDTNPDSVLVPPMLIQPFVENAILHGLMPLSDRRGHLTIDFSQEGNILNCVIEDNGIGRAAAEEIKLKKSSTHVSMGTSVTQERLDILNKQTGIPTQVMIIDKDEDGVPTGTIVKICIELKKK